MLEAREVDNNKIRKALMVNPRPLDIGTPYSEKYSGSTGAS